MPQKNIKNKGYKGFTVVEIMIGLLIFALLFMGFNEFMMHGRRQTENLFQKGDNLRETRLALQWFEKDVRSSVEILEYDEDLDRITMTLKHVKEIKANVDPITSDTMVYDYIIYTLYLKQKTVNGKDLKPLYLVRTQTDTQPAAGAMASDNILLKSGKDNITENPIGVLPNHEFVIDGVGTVKKESKFFVIDTNYYVNIALDDTITPDKKEEMIAKATYKGKYNGAVAGYTDIKNSAGVWLQFVIGDNNKNVYFFNQIIYMRTKL